MKMIDINKIKLHKKDRFSHCDSERSLFYRVRFQDIRAASRNIPRIGAPGSALSDDLGRQTVKPAPAISLRFIIIKE